MVTRYMKQTDEHWINEEYTKSNEAYFFLFAIDIHLLPWIRCGFLWYCSVHSRKLHQMCGEREINEKKKHIESISLESPRTRGDDEHWIMFLVNSNMRESFFFNY